MARIAGVDLPPAKRAEIGLTYIYGVGRTRSRSLLYRAGIEFDKKVRDLTEDEVNRVRQILEEEGAVEGDLRPHRQARVPPTPRCLSAHWDARGEREEGRGQREDSEREAMVVPCLRLPFDVFRLTFCRPC